MEKEGLHRVIQFLQENGLEIEALVTDRHVQIKKWLPETHPSITHYFDVRHVAKGIRSIYSLEINYLMLSCTSILCRFKKEP